jgi:hypothetical protein
MVTKDEIAEQLKARFSSVRERAGVLAQALRERAEIAAARRRLRSACADLGEEVYKRMSAKTGAAVEVDAALEEFRARIDGVHAELRQRERALAAILDGGKASSAARQASPPEAPMAAADQPARG